MWFEIAKFLGGFISGPFLQGALDAYKAKLTLDNNQDVRTVALASKELDLQEQQQALQNQLKIAEIGHWYEPEKLFGYVVLVYFAKLLIWDKVLGSLTHGTTDPLTGWSGITATAVVGFYFTYRGAQDVVRILKRS